MKPKSTLRSFLLLAGSSLLALSSLPAATFYWDGTSPVSTAGFGTAGGTWAQSSTTGFNWTTSNTGAIAGNPSQPTADTDSFNFGTATAGVAGGSITVSGTVSMGDTTYGSASGAIVLTGGTINFGAAKTITVNNTTNTISSVIGGAATSLTKAGTGTLVLTGTNTYTGTTIINRGSIDLGGGTANGSLASTVLTLGGGTLSYTRTGGTTQGFTTTNINATPASVINVASGNTLNLGTVARANGVSLDLSTGLGAGIVAADTASNTGGIMPGFTFGDTWATATGTITAIAGLGSYTATSGLGTSAGSYTGNIDVNSSEGTLDGGITANSLRFNAGAANTLSLTGANTITTGGILVGSGVGSNLSTISGGTLTGTASKDLVIAQNNASAGLTISSDIIDSSGTALTKSGAGLLTLSGNNTFTGGVFINGGKITLANAGALNSTAGSENAVTFGSGSIGTLTLNGNSVVIRSLATNAASPGTAIVENASATPVTLTVGNSGNASGTFAGIIQDGTGGGALALTKAGTGTLTLSNANTYTGGTTLSAGTVTASNATSFGTGDVLVTGNSRINATGGITYANNITVNASQTLTMQNPATTTSTATFSGVLAGSGIISLPNSGTNGQQGILSFTNTGNTFTGNVVLSGSGAGDEFFSFNSIGDGGNFTFAKNGNRQGIRHAGSSNITFGTRAINIATTMVNYGTRQGLDGGGGNPVCMFENNGAGTITFNSNMTMTSLASDGVLYFGGSNTGNNTFAGTIDDPTGTGKLWIGKLGAGTWYLTNDNTYEGGTIIANGILSVGKIEIAANAQPLGKGSTIQLGVGNSGTNGTLEFTGSTNSTTDKQVVVGPVTQANGTGVGSIVINGSGTLTFSNSTFNPTILTSTTPPSNAVTVARTLTLGGSNTGANTISGVIQDNNGTTGPVGLTKSGDGTWVLSGNNTFSGAVTVSDGVLSIQHSNALGANTKTVTVAGNASTFLVPEMQLSGGISPTIATLTVSGAGAANTTGAINNVSGSNSLTVTGNINLIAGNGGSTFYSTAGTLTINAAQIAANAATRTLALAGPGNGIINAPIANGSTVNMPLTKTGAGTWTLNGTNTYSGTTAVNGGTLVLSSTGSIANSASVTIGAAGTLDTSAQGTYTIPGAQPLAFGIDATSSGSSGKIAAAGLDITNAVVTYNITGTPDDPVYVLATYTSLTGASFATVDPAPAGYTLNYAYEGNKIALVQTGGPSGFAAWQSANGTGGGLGDDHDNDGVDNGTEFFIYGPVANSGFTALPGVVNNAGTLSVTWPKAATYSGSYTTDYVVETSDNLSGWSPAATNGSPNVADTVYIDTINNTVTYTFAAPGTKKFARLKVTGPN